MQTAGTGPPPSQTAPGHVLDASCDFHNQYGASPTCKQRTNKQAINKHLNRETAVLTLGQQANAYCISHATTKHSAHIDFCGGLRVYDLLLHDIFVSLSDLRHLAMFLCKASLLCCSEAGNAVLLKRNKTSRQCFLKKGVEDVMRQAGGRNMEAVTRMEANASSGPNNSHAYICVH